ncbi:hypothetical protein HK097_011106 [Rhizophlyctis rosea]|uniref:SH3 domain-containing protein n=1 Tax=Rhizophlyctis rosea TaxID=64517 RepID=A0AAD5X8M1_9FUNG|nr:hypothetical protein HK097_011106 [Rhizophlyctis rosea]
MLWAPAFNSEPQDKEKGHTDGHLTRVGESNGFYYFDAPSSSDVSSQATIKKPQKAVERKYGGGVMDKDVSYKVVTAERSQGMDGRNGMEEFRAPVNSSQHPIAQIRPYESYSTNRTLIPHRPDRYEKQNEYRPASVQTAQSSRAALDRHASIFSQVQIPNIHNKPRHQHHDSLKPWNEPLLPSLESHSSSGFPTPPIYIPNVATPPTPIPPLAVHQNPHLAHLALPPPKQNQRDQRHHHHQPGTHPHRFSSTSTVGNVVTLYTHPSLQPYQQPLTNLGRISEEKPHSPTPSGSTGSTIITKSSIPIGASADVRIIGNGIRGSHNGSGGSKNTTTAISSMRRLMVHQQRSGTETYAAYEHMPSLADEVLVRKGDRLLVEQTFADGWAYGWNVRSRTRGMFPIGCLEVVGVTYPGMGGRVGEEVEAPRRTSSLVRRVVPGG